MNSNNNLVKNLNFTKYKMFEVAISYLQYHMHHDSQLYSLSLFRIPEMQTTFLEVLIPAFKSLSFSSYTDCIIWN